jgi:hypothetical protein
MQSALLLDIARCEAYPLRCRLRRILSYPCPCHFHLLFALLLFFYFISCTLIIHLLHSALLEPVPWSSKR